MICSFWLVSALAKAARSIARSSCPQPCLLRQRPGPARRGDRHHHRRAARQLPPSVQPHRTDHRRVGDRQGARPGFMTTAVTDNDSGPTRLDSTPSSATPATRAVDRGRRSRGPGLRRRRGRAVLHDAATPWGRPFAVGPDQAPGAGPARRRVGGGGGGERRQWDGVRPRRRAGRLRAGKPLGARPDQPPQPRHPRARDRRRGLARAPVQLAQRRHRRERRRDLVHRPLVWPPPGLQREPASATTSIATILPAARRPSSPTDSTSPTESHSRRTSASSTSPTAAPTRSRGATTSTVHTTSRRST